MDWYVIQAYSGYEQKVKAALEERIALNNLSEKFGEILIPTEQIVELKGGAKKTTERKFFPGYILVQMNLEDDSWQLVQSTPRVSGFVGGTRDKPLPISEEDVSNIINRIEVGEDAPAPKQFMSLVKLSEYVMDHLMILTELLKTSIMREIWLKFLFKSLVGQLQLS